MKSKDCLIKEYMKWRNYDGGLSSLEEKLTSVNVKQINCRIIKKH